MRKVQFAVNNFYHIYNRGVEKRDIFMNSADFGRFYASMFIFNNVLHRSNVGRLCSTLSVVQHSVLNSGEDREPLVRILGFCLMSNHFHMLMEPLVENGVPKFMHKLLMGYSKYFNQKYDRKGRLYEGEFKAVLAESDAQFRHLLRYIHLNALDLTDLNWRDGKITNWDRASEFLEKYPWSSHNVHLGKPQILPVVEKGIMSEIFNTPKQYLKFLKDWSGRATPQNTE